MPRLSLRPGVARTVSAGGALALALGLAACGSQLDPAARSPAPPAAAPGPPRAVRWCPAPRRATPPAESARPPVAPAPARAAPRPGAAPPRAARRPAARPRRRVPGPVAAVAAVASRRGRQRRRRRGRQAAAATASRTVPAITDSEITIGNASDISGPVPGLFESSQEAVKAYVAYFNSTSDICGRKLELATYDSRTDAGADQQAYAKGCDEVFAMVGSMRAFDSGGAATAQSCGLPDIRSAAVTKDRNACSTCFPAQSVNTGEWENAPGEFIKKNYPDAAAHAAVALHQRRRRRRERQPVEVRAMTKQGLHFDVRPGHRRLGVQLRAVRPAAQGQGREGRPLGRLLPAVASGSPRPCSSSATSPTSTCATPPTTSPTSSSPAATRSTGPWCSSTSCRSRRPTPTPEMQLYLQLAAAGQPRRDADLLRASSRGRRRGCSSRRRSPSAASSAARRLIDALAKTDNWTANGMTAPQHVGHQADRRLLAVHPAQRRQLEAGGRDQVHLRRHTPG